MNRLIGGKLVQETRSIRQEVRQQTLGYIIAAFGLVAGLAWNEAIKALIERFFKDGSDSLSAKFLYAIVITLAVVILTIYLARLKEKKAIEAEVDQVNKIE